MLPCAATALLMARAPGREPPAGGESPSEECAPLASRREVVPAAPQAGGRRVLPAPAVGPYSGARGWAPGPPAAAAVAAAAGRGRGGDRGRGGQRARWWYGVSRGALILRAPGRAMRSPYAYRFHRPSPLRAPDWTGVGAEGR